CVQEDGQPTRAQTEGRAPVPVERGHAGQATNATGAVRSTSSRWRAGVRDVTGVRPPDDAQPFWDGDLRRSPLHGIPTVIGGNCGFTIAPIRLEHGDYLMRMLARVEGMPLNSLRLGVPWGSWQSFGEWLAKLDGTLA